MKSNGWTAPKTRLRLRLPHLDARPVIGAPQAFALDIREMHVTQNWAREIRYLRYTVRVLRRGADLSPEERHTLVSNLHAGMKGWGITQYFDRHPNVFRDSDACVVGFDNMSGQAVGILSGRWFEVFGERCFYILNAFVADSYRGRGLFIDLEHVVLEQLYHDDGSFPPAIALKTRNPAVYESLLRFTAVPGVRIYPEIPALRQHPELVGFAREFMAQAFPDLSLCVQTGVVPCGQAAVCIDLFPRMMKCRSADIQRHFEHHLTRADQVLCVVRTPAEAQPLVAHILLDRAEWLAQVRMRTGTGIPGGDRKDGSDETVRSRCAAER